MAEQQAKVFPTPVDWDELYPGRFLKAADLKGKKVTLKIAGVKLEELIGDKGPQVKGLISFDRTEKQLALNKTNGICLKDMFGKKVQEWIGKRVTLFPTTYNDDDCIRVWGSPDIEADKPVTIALPRKRPFQMTMHRTVPQSAGGNGASTNTATTSGNTAEKPSDDESIKALRGQQTMDSLLKTRKSVWALYAAAGAEVPLEVEAAANEHRETLEQQE
jgi:hypothetical protein